MDVFIRLCIYEDKSLPDFTNNTSRYLPSAASLAPAIRYSSDVECGPLNRLTLLPPGPPPAIFLYPASDTIIIFYYYYTRWGSFYIFYQLDVILRWKVIANSHVMKRAMHLTALPTITYKLCQKGLPLDENITTNDEYYRNVCFSWFFKVILQ